MALRGNIAAEDSMDVLQGRLIDGDYEILILDTKLLFVLLKFNCLTLTL